MLGLIPPLFILAPHICCLLRGSNSKMLNASSTIFFPCVCRSSPHNVWELLWQTGSEINFFQQAPTRDQNFFFSRQMEKCGRQKVSAKTFHLQQNTSQNYWSPQACQQNICNQYNQESNWVLKSFFDHFDRPTLPPFDAQRIYLHLISSRKFCLHLIVNYRKILEHLRTPHRLNKYSWRKNAWDLLRPQYMCYGKPLKKHDSETLHCS